MDRDLRTIFPKRVDYTSLSPQGREILNKIMARRAKRQESLEHQHGYHQRSDDIVYYSPNHLKADALRAPVDRYENPHHISKSTSQDKIIDNEKRVRDIQNRQKEIERRQRDLIEQEEELERIKEQKELYRIKQKNYQKYDDNLFRSPGNPRDDSTRPPTSGSPPISSNFNNSPYYHTKNDTYPHHYNTINEKFVSRQHERGQGRFPREHIDRIDKNGHINKHDMHFDEASPNEKRMRLMQKHNKETFQENPENLSSKRQEAFFGKNNYDHDEDEQFDNRDNSKHQRAELDLHLRSGRPHQRWNNRAIGRDELRTPPLLPFQANNNTAGNSNEREAIIAGYIDPRYDRPQRFNPRDIYPSTPLTVWERSLPITPHTKTGHRATPKRFAMETHDEERDERDEDGYLSEEDRNPKFNRWQPANANHGKRSSAEFDFVEKGLNKKFRQEKNTPPHVRNSPSKFHSKSLSRSRSPTGSDSHSSCLSREDSDTEWRRRKEENLPANKTIRIETRYGRDDKSRRPQISPDPRSNISKTSRNVRLKDNCDRPRTHRDGNRDIKRDGRQSGVSSSNKTKTTAATSNNRNYRRDKGNSSSESDEVRDISDFERGQSRNSKRSFKKNSETFNRNNNSSNRRLTSFEEVRLARRFFDEEAARNMKVHSSCWQCIFSISCIESLIWYMHNKGCARGVADARSVCKIVSWVIIVAIIVIVVIVVIILSTG